MKEWRDVFNLCFGERFQQSPWQPYLTWTLQHQLGVAVKTISIVTNTIRSHYSRKYDDVGDRNQFSRYTHEMKVSSDTFFGWNYVIFAYQRCRASKPELALTCPINVVVKILTQLVKLNTHWQRSHITEAWLANTLNRADYFTSELVAPWLILEFLLNQSPFQGSQCLVN